MVLTHEEGSLVFTVVVTVGPGGGVLSRGLGSLPVPALPTPTGATGSAMAGPVPAAGLRTGDGRLTLDEFPALQPSNKHALAIHAQRKATKTWLTICPS
jgi:hypothetical protein